MQEYQYAGVLSMQEYNYAGIFKGRSISMQEYKYAGVQVCRSISMQDQKRTTHVYIPCLICRNASGLLFTNISMQEYKYKYAGV